MSGGHFQYEDSRLKNTIFDWEDKVTDQFEDMEISHLVWDVLNLIHDYDWYASGDTGKEDWLKAKAEFKEKWLKGDRNKLLESIIDERLAEVGKQLKEML